MGRRAVTYASVYNAMYGSYLAGGTPRATIDKKLKWHDRVHHSRLAIKIVQTQSRLAPWLLRTGHGDALMRLHAAYMRGCICRLRGLQRAIVAYLWRPGSRLYEANYAALASM